MDIHHLHLLVGSIDAGHVIIAHAKSPGKKLRLEAGEDAYVCTFLGRGPTVVISGRFVVLWPVCDVSDTRQRHFDDFVLGSGPSKSCTHVPRPLVGIRSVDEGVIVALEKRAECTSPVARHLLEAYHWF
jgi:hypothetical protein